MKKCDSCGNNFNIISNSHGGQNRRYCYNCYPNGLSKHERDSVRMDLLRKRADKEKIEMGCKICGYNKTSLALEWHHTEDDKLDNPSNLLNKSWKRYKKEIDKCVLLCSNCHRELHSGITKM